VTPYPKGWGHYVCTMIYRTHAGHRRQFRTSVYAMAADLAVETAEKLLRADKRRHVARVTYSDAIQC